VARAPSPWELTRPGIALYGSPSAGPLGLHPVLHVHARVVDVHDLTPGDTVSYEATWTATRATRLATIALGHGDGYRRALSNRGIALLHGRRVPVAGVVTMDMTMLDVTDVPCAVGDVVTLVGRDALGSDPLTLDEVAALGDLSPYELLVGWRLRLPRVYRP
jgi:alanine racemase